MDTWITNITANTKAMVLADQMVFSGNSFLTTLLMARILSPTNFGIYASIILFVYLGVGILNALIMQPLQVTLPKIADKATYISFTFWLQLGLVLFFSLGVVFVLSLDMDLFALYNDLAQAIICLAFGFVMQDYFRKLFLASGQLKRTFLVDALTAVLHMGILITAFFRPGLTLMDSMYYLGIAYLPAIILGIVFIAPRHYKAPMWESYLLKHIQQGKWLLMTALVQWWSSNLFVVASGVFLGIKALGAFRLVQSLFGILNILLQTFENYVLPQASRILVNSHAEAKMYIKQIGIKSSILFAIILLPVFVLSEHIIVLAGGPEYAVYSYVVKGMAVLYLFIFVGYPIRISIRVLILNKNFFMGYVFSLLFSLLSFNFLLKEWGLMGAITGLIASQLIVLGYWQFILMKKNFVLWK